jgi:predicted anti-sigma-YlaC factor YlaD
MRCKKCQQSLYEYIDNTLPSEQSNLIREHLDDCPDCRAFYASEWELSRNFHETAARLEERLHFQFRQPDSLDRSPNPIPSRLSFPVVKWASAAILLTILMVCTKLLIFRPSERQLDQSARIAGSSVAAGHQNQSEDQSDNEKGIIQIISIEDASGQVDETLFRREIDGVIADITVEVTAVRVEGKSKG